MQEKSFIKAIFFFTVSCFFCLPWQVGDKTTERGAVLPAVTPYLMATCSGTYGSHYHPRQAHLSPRTLPRPKWGPLNPCLTEVSLVNMSWIVTGYVSGPRVSRRMRQSLHFHRADNFLGTAGWRQISKSLSAWVVINAKEKINCTERSKFFGDLLKSGKVTRERGM